MKDVVGRIRAKFAGIRIIGATLPSALGSTNANHGSPEENSKRKTLNGGFVPPPAEGWPRKRHPQ